MFFIMFVWCQVVFEAIGEQGMFLAIRIRNPFDHREQRAGAVGDDLLCVRGAEVVVAEDESALFALLRCSSMGPYEFCR